MRNLISEVSTKLGIKTNINEWFSSYLFYEIEDNGYYKLKYSYKNEIFEMDMDISNYKSFNEFIVKNNKMLLSDEFKVISMTEDEVRNDLILSRDDLFNGMNIIVLEINGSLETVITNNRGQQNINLNPMFPDVKEVNIVGIESLEVMKVDKANAIYKLELNDEISLYVNSSNDSEISIGESLKNIMYSKNVDMIKNLKITEVSKNEINDLVNSYNYENDEYFSQFNLSENDSFYGCDQGVFNTLGVMNPVILSRNSINSNGPYTQEYSRLAHKLETKYGFSLQESYKVLELLDDTGACSYAAIVNTIFSKYRNNPEIFKKTFGFDMYAKIGNDTRLNTSELLMDIYVNLNSDKYGGKLFKTVDNKLCMVEDYDSKNQQYCSYSSGVNTYLINNYLINKGIILTSKENEIVFNSKLELLNFMMNSIKNNKLINLVVIADKNHVVRFVNPNGNVYYDTQTWKEDGGHAVFITGITNEGIAVSSWGKKLIIPTEDFIGSDNFRFSEISFMEVSK